ncbi:IS3 family transposase [Salinibacterium sp. SWN167]
MSPWCVWISRLNVSIACEGSLTRSCAVTCRKYGVYGRWKTHALLRRRGWVIGRDQTERLMRPSGVRGVRRSRRGFTTRAGSAIDQPKDSRASRVHRVKPTPTVGAAVTSVATWRGFAWATFITDVFSRRIIGWNVESMLRAESLPLQ